MPSPLRQLRRQQILDAARQIVSQDGLEALTISALEKAVDFSRGVITYHFKNKDEIVEAVLLSAVAEINERLKAVSGQSLGPGDEVKTILRTVLHGFLDHPEAGRILLSFWSQLQSNERIRRINAELYRGYRAWSAKLLEKHKDACAQVSVDGLAGVMVGLVIGLAVQTYFDPENFEPEPALEEACASVLARLGLS